MDLGQTRNLELGQDVHDPVKPEDRKRKKTYGVPSSSPDAKGSAGTSQLKTNVRRTEDFSAELDVYTTHYK